MGAIAFGVRFGYLDNVHVVVYTHDDNISFASPKSVESRLAAMKTYLGALDVLAQELVLSARERRAVCPALKWRFGIRAICWFNIGVTVMPLNGCVMDYAVAPQILGIGGLLY